jgi:hypothetical protein
MSSTGMDRDVDWDVDWDVAFMAASFVAGDSVCRR